MEILALPFHDWRKAEAEGFRTRDGHILEHLAASEAVDRLLVIDRPVSSAERLLGRVPRDPSGETIASFQERSLSATITQVSDRVAVLDFNVHALIRPALLRRGWWFEAFRRRDVLDAIAWAVDRQLGSDVRAIAWVPAIAPVIVRVDPSVFLYDSLDNWLIHPVLRRQRRAASGAYATMLPRADHVVVSGPASARILARWASGIEIVPNGVDPERFSGADRRARVAGGRTVVGYIGKMAERLDVDLVEQVAGLLSGVEFVFAGPVLSRAPRRLARLPNVRMLRDQPYSKIPELLNTFDIAWIPHRVGKGETGGDPIKLYEYWAAGLPVISTRIDGWQAWTEGACIADSATEIADLIRLLGAGHADPRVGRVPASRTWAAITDLMLQRLASRSASDPSSP